jgi:SpoVK/Ycf46/Vps4 family AAA+-type ATPase
MGPITQEAEEGCFLEPAALDRLIHVLDVCQLLPNDSAVSSSEAAALLQDVVDSLCQIQALKAVWVREMDNMKHLLALEECIGTTRRKKQAFSKRINRQLQDLRAASQLERICLQQKDQEEHWESFLGTILAHAKLVWQQQLNHLQDLEKALDEIYQHDDTNSIRSIGDDSAKSGKIDRITADLQRSAQILSGHPMVQTAKSLLFDLVDTSQLLCHNTDSSSSRLFSERPLEVPKPRCGVDAPAMLDVLDADSPIEAFHRFCRRSSASDDRTRTSFTIISITGDEGTGKSYSLDQMTKAHQAAYTISTSVFRPSVPLDFLLPIVGDMENTIIAMFEAAVEAKSCVILLDNADDLLWKTDDTSSRCWASCLLSTMASLQQSLRVGSNILVVVCSKRQASVLGLPADKTFLLSLPDAAQRRVMIGDSFNLQSGAIKNDKKMQRMAVELAEMTSGRSYADLVQFIRQAFEQVAMSHADDHACSAEEETCKAMLLLKDRLSKSIPPSLRIGRLDSEFDVVILNGTDLTLSDAEASAFPFKGSSVIKAFQALNRAIVVPFCQYQRFQYLCGSGTSDGRSLLAGVLLSGGSGCGKSTLAMYCAKRIAASVATLTVLVVSCTSLIHKEVGGSEQAVRRLFAAARQATPCLVVLEGTENIAATRGNDCTTEGTMDRVLSTLLVELDGVGSDQGRNTDGRLAIIATTIEETWVDAALKRPGRLGNAIFLAKDWT